MTLNFYTNGEILLDGKRTNLAFRQKSDRTVVYTPEWGRRPYREHEMPHARYSTVANPRNGVAGNAQFEADIRALLARLVESGEMSYEPRDGWRHEPQDVGGEPRWASGVSPAHDAK
jgi:hypothetical protein